MRNHRRRPGAWRRWLFWLGVAWAATGLLPGARAAEAKKVDLSVKGMGWIRDREMRFALQRLLDVGSQPALSANAIEDAAVILISALGEEGFQRPRIDIVTTTVDGTRREMAFDPTFAQPLPRSLAAKGVEFRVTRGVRSHIAVVEISGLTAIEEKRARAFFRTEAVLLASAKTNAFAPARLTRGADALQGELRQRGFAESEVKAEKVAEAPDGAVTVRVEVKEGPRWIVDAVRMARDEGDAVTLPEVAGWVGQPWSPTLHEDIREGIRQAYYNKGYPDIGVHVAAETEPGEPGTKRALVQATIVPGPHVKVGTVHFAGNHTTRESVLRRRVQIQPGDELNPVTLERARYRIARLGVFEAVDLKYEPEDGGVRDPIFTVRERPRYETHLLAGYGSYEQLRAGVEYRQMNILGMAHQSRLELVQSMKSTSGDYRYTVPELFGESLDGTARLFGLQRKEIAFLRQEFGVDVSLKRRLPRIGGEAAVGYTFAAFRNRENVLLTRETDDSQINVASVTVALSGDRRDNPLRSRRGYSWSSQLEAAAPIFGGESTYQRFEVNGSYHTSWGEGRWIHAGISEGIITTFGSTDARLPVNKRFYPGGDSSIRGYQRGEAAPRGADGYFVGAKGFLLLSVELEQALTTSWSAVAFFDALGTAVSLRDLPFKERLYSAGLGIRYQTLIGPVRLEYGRNINRRTNDPSGTWHLSIGMPF